MLFIHKTIRCLQRNWSFPRSGSCTR